MPKSIQNSDKDCQMIRLLEKINDNMTTIARALEKLAEMKPVTVSIHVPPEAFAGSDGAVFQGIEVITEETEAESKGEGE